MDKEVAATSDVATIEQNEAGEEITAELQSDPSSEVSEQKTVKEPKSKKEVVKPLVYFASARVTCACGNTFTTGSTKEEIKVEICNNCHPFFTGQEKFVDTEGRVERFMKKYGKRTY